MVGVTELVQGSFCIKDLVVFFAFLGRSFVFWPPVSDIGEGQAAKVKAKEQTDFYVDKAFGIIICEFGPNAPGYYHTHR